jgi:hypothetical protein
MASARLAYAIIAAGALLWVYGLSALSVYTCSRIFPVWGRSMVLTFLASFFGGLYLLWFWFISPLTAMEVFFLVSLIPLLCAGSGVFNRIESLDLGEAAARALSEAAVFGAILIVFSIIREPLGFGSLSVPGASLGIVTLFYLGDVPFLPVCLIAGSAGALLLLGYGVGLYRHFRKIHAPREDEL